MRDGGGRETGLVTLSGSASAFAGFRFPREVISVAVRCRRTETEGRAARVNRVGYVASATPGVV